MVQCAVCHEETLREQPVDAWMQRGSRWVLLRNVPGTKCDTCGEATFSQHVAEQIAAVLSADSSYIPSGFVTCAEYNFARLGKPKMTIVKDGRVVLPAEVTKSPFFPRVISEGTAGKVPVS